MFRRTGAVDEPDLDRLNLALIDAVRATGRAFLSSTRLRGRTAIRFCFVNWRTTAADVEEVVRLLGELGTGLASRRIAASSPGRWAMTRRLGPERRVFRRIILAYTGIGM